MKLSAEEINYVFNYIKNIDVKYYELQVELTDHLVLIMEEIWTEDPELTFHQVMFRAERRFGKSPKKIEQERIQTIVKEKNNKQFKLFMEYLKFPKILFTTVLVFLVCMGSFYLEKRELYIKLLCYILIFLSAFQLINWFRFKKINGKKFLSIETAFKLNTSVSSFSFLMSMFSSGISNNSYIILPICILWVFIFLFVITDYQITNKAVIDIKKQYQFI
jgi:hypothetical protein